MEVYWRHRRRGQNLILNNENGDGEEEVGGFRETKRGIDAYAKTFSYDPGRSEKDFPTIEDAKAFVESFRPWELYEGAQGLTVEPEVRPALDSAPTATPSASEQPPESGMPEPVAEAAAPEQPAASGTPAPVAETAAPEQPAASGTPAPVTEAAPDEQPAASGTPEPVAEIATAEQPPEASTPAQPPEPIAPSPQPRKRWWEFWKQG